MPFFSVGRLVHWLPLGIAAQLPSTTPWHKNLTNSKLWHGKMNPTVGENSFNPGHHKLFGCCICHKWSYVQPAEEYQSVKPCEEQRNVCSKSALVYNDGSSFCVPHRQPYNASAPDQTKMLCEYIHFLNMSYIPWQRNKYMYPNCKLSTCGDTWEELLQSKHRLLNYGTTLIIWKGSKMDRITCNWNESLRYQ